MQQDLEQRTRSTVALLVSYGLQGKDLVNVLVQAPRVLAQTLPQLTTRISFAARHLGANLQVCGTGQALVPPRPACTVQQAPAGISQA